MAVRASFLSPIRARFVAPVIAAATLLVFSVWVQAAHAATFNVNTSADTVDASPGNGTCADVSGNCSLRAAIMEANAYGGTDGILLPPGVFTLTITGTNEDAAATGDLDITSDISIVGAVHRRTIVDGGAIDRVFDIFSPASVQISQLTVRNGQPEVNCEGGGIRNGNGASLTLNYVSVRNNTTTGTASCPNSSFDAEGGGLFNIGTLDLANTTFAWNTAAAETGGGGLMNVSPGTVSASNVTFTGNTAPNDGSGGGLRNQGSMSISYATFISNTAGNAGGGFRNSGTLTMSHVTITGNHANSNGGGFRSTEPSTTLTIDDCKISGNSADDHGGGFRAGGSFTMTNCTVTGNSATSLLDGGGGFSVRGAGTVQLTNVYVSNNVATNYGGGVWEDSGDNPTLTLTSVTITRNFAGSDGGGIWLGTGTVNFINSHVNHNKPNNCVGTATCPA